MPYIPERRYEDAPDTFTPFVPMDHDNIVEVCEQHLKENTALVKSDHRQLAKFILFFVIGYYSLKRYKTF